MDLLLVGEKPLAAHTIINGLGDFRGPAERGPGLGFQTGPRGAGPCTTVIP